MSFKSNNNNNNHNNMLLPHAVAAAVPPRSRSSSSYFPGGTTSGGSRQNLRSSPSSSSSSFVATSRCTTVFLMALAAIPAFCLGTLLSLYASIDCPGGASSSVWGHTNPILEMLVEHRVQQRVQEWQQQLEAQHQMDVEAQVQLRLAAAVSQGGEIVGSGSSTTTTHEALFPKEDLGKFVVGMARVAKEEFVQHLDPGVPLDLPQDGKHDVLLLYSHPGAVPKAYHKTGLNGGGSSLTNNPRLTMPQATERCDQVNVILAHNGGDRKQCWAIVPQYESYHIQKWMRLPPTARNNSTDLRLVSRGQVSNGMDRFRPPFPSETRSHWKWLQTYLSHLDDVLDELRPILKQIAVDNTVVVLVCNFGQSELLLNFVCSARARGFDTSRILLFATDVETMDLAQSLGLNVYFDHRNFGPAPLQAANKYGDRTFVAMMLAKVVCVQMVSMLGYNFLFQDVDIVWYKDPVEYFLQPSIKATYDVLFQDDGGHSIRYAPYSANSGFYFVYNNDRTRHFLNSLLTAGDLIVSTKSHQQALIALLQEHVSLHGMRAKVLSRDMEEFPGGYHFNQKTGKYMRALFAGEVHPYIFHMSWTENKHNKLLYFRQMGEWWVQDQCIAQKRDDILQSSQSSSPDLAPLCCAAEPLVTCHYRDKPSKIPCKEAPNLDKGRPSFW